jgi:hypothetical protein
MVKSTDNPQFRSQRRRLGAYTSWGKTEDRAARTLPARRAVLDKFETEVDPGSKLTIQERAKRAEYAREASYQRLAMKSGAARQERKLICQKCGQPKESDAQVCRKCLGALRHER